MEGSSAGEEESAAQGEGRRAWTDLGNVGSWGAGGAREGPEEGERPRPRAADRRQQVRVGRIGSEGTLAPLLLAWRKEPELGPGAPPNGRPLFVVVDGGGGGWGGEDRPVLRLNKTRNRIEIHSVGMYLQEQAGRLVLSRRAGEKGERRGRGRTDP